MRRLFHSQQVEVFWYTSTWHISMVMDDITVIGWLHQHRKNYWLYTWQCRWTVYVNERQYWVHNFLFPYINGSTPRAGSNYYLRIRSLIHGNMLSSSLKKQWNGQVSLNNDILEVDYKTIINKLNKHLYITLQCFYITNWLISGKISKVIYKPTKIMKSDYFTQTIQEN